MEYKLLLLIALLLFVGCAITDTEITETTWDESTGVLTSTRMTIDAVVVGGRVLNRAAYTEYSGPGWSMIAQDGAREIGSDPDVAKAIAEGAAAGVLQAISRIGMPVP